MRSDTLNGLPMWAKAAATISTTSAIIMIAFYFAYAVVDLSRAQTEERSATGQTLLSLVVDQGETLERHIAQTDGRLAAILAVLQQICLQDAITSERRQRCLQP